ncbi:MAG: hypothetical protein QG659_406 [Patescibacteria group bacterium]|jgi:hypothetical protein|nr:hypothetical protein [Patescibacteria group bacterium]
MSKIQVAKRGQTLHEVFIDLNTDFRTNRRGTDFTIYVNTGYVSSDDDCDLLKALASHLINFDTGVSQIVVTPYRMVITVIKLTVDDVMEEVSRLCHHYVTNVEVTKDIVEITN